MALPPLELFSLREELPCCRAALSVFAGSFSRPPASPAPARQLDSGFFPRLTVDQAGRANDPRPSVTSNCLLDTCFFTATFARARLGAKVLSFRPVIVFLEGWVDDASAGGRMRVAGRADGPWTAQRSPLRSPLNPR